MVFLYNLEGYRLGNYNCLIVQRVVGGHSECETPDPFPNSEAKALTPMVVCKRESRSPPTFTKALWLPQRAFFLRAIMV